MCGRFALEGNWDEMLKMYRATGSLDPEIEMPSRYNIAPTQPIIVVRAGEIDEREAELVRWGLMPSWVKDPSKFSLLINARSETASEKPSFKSAMRHRRVLIPATGFYEWQRFGNRQKSQPFWVTPSDGQPMAMGGLMETWANADGSEIDTACILTTAANDSFSAIHHRLPLVIAPGDWERWLDCKTQEPGGVRDLLAPASDEFFSAVPVSDAVNKVTNNDPCIQEPVELVERDATADLSDGQMSFF